MKNDLFLRALKGEKVDRPPVWMMRQAGRYLPDFMKIKRKYDFFTRCQTPELATEINSSVENIGARRLHTIIEKVLDEISFTATDRSGEKITINKTFVQKNLGELVKDTDLSKFIL